jgi:hypothetical protein
MRISERRVVGAGVAGGIELALVRGFSAEGARASVSAIDLDGTMVGYEARVMTYEEDVWT